MYLIADMRMVRYYNLDESKYETKCKIPLCALNFFCMFAKHFDVMMFIRSELFDINFGAHHIIVLHLISIYKLFDKITIEYK